MRTNFVCTNYLNTPGYPGHPGKIPRTSQTLRAQILKNFNLDGKFQFRLKFSISIEIFNLDLQNSPQKMGVCWVARLKSSISIENVTPGGRS